MDDRHKKSIFLISTFSLLFLIASMLMHGWLLFVLKRGQALAIQRVLNEHILLGDRREVLAVMDQAMAFGFKTVIVKSRGYDGAIKVGFEKISWWDRKIIHKIYFDSLKQYESGEMEFIYSGMEGIENALLVWILVTFAISLPIKFTIDRQAALFDQKAEATKNREILAIVNSLAHDIRAPLGIFERLLFLPENTTLVNERQNIRTGLYRLNSLIDSLRRSEIETIVSISRCRFDPKRGLSMLKHRIDQRNLKIRLAIHENLYMRIDELKFERAWLNLVSNAIDFATKEIAIETEVCETQLVLRVIDDGKGVSENFLPKLFQRGATQGKADGTGLGLVYVRQIMRGHGGDVSYRRENGLTIFECILPNAVESEEEKQVEKSATLEIQLMQKTVRKVAISLEPRELSASVLVKMASLKSDEFTFIEERQEADIVVSNIDSIMFEIMESEEQELISVAQFKHDENFMIKMLRLKFNLSGEPSDV